MRLASVFNHYEGKQKMKRRFVMSVGGRDGRLIRMDSIVEVVMKVEMSGRVCLLGFFRWLGRVERRNELFHRVWVGRL